MSSAHAVRRILDRVPSVSLTEIDEALAWLACRQREQVEDLEHFNVFVYQQNLEAIDALLDARLALMHGVRS